MTAALHELMKDLKLTSEEIAKLREELDTTEDSAEKENVLKRLEDAVQTECSIKASLFDEWSNATSDRESLPSSPPRSMARKGDSDTVRTLGESSGLHDLSTTSGDRPASTRPAFSAHLMQPKQYHYGDDFTTWCSRFRRYLNIGKITDDNAVVRILS